jgi:hypothetical protein
MNSITDHGIVLPDPAVCFDDHTYEPNDKNDFPRIYDGLLLALRQSDGELFLQNIQELYSNFKPCKTLEKQLLAAVSGFNLKLKTSNINYKGPKGFTENGFYNTTIDTDPLMECLKKEIDELRNKPPTRNARVQDRIVNLPKHHIIYEKLLDVYTKLNLLEDSYMITDINLHISDNEDTFNEYFQADQKTKPKNKLYTLHIDPKYSYIKNMIYLNEVKRENGPLAYIPESHRWKFDEVEMLFCKSNQLANTLSDSSQRKINAGLPLWARKNSYFSRQFKDEDLVSERLYKNLKHFTSDETNFILFEPNHGWHRGTHVDEGERIALQVIMKP